MGSKINLDEKGNPLLLPLRVSNIPVELRIIDQWVCWWLKKDNDNKWKKVPLNPNDVNKFASVTSPSTWSNYLIAAAAEAEALRGVDGIGFVLTSNDGFVGIDLDECIDADTGDIEEWAQLIIDNFDSYTEKSPTGYGIRIFIKGTLPNQTGIHNGKIELYEKGRFLTVTGNYISKYGDKIKECQVQLDQLLAQLNTDAKKRQPEKVAKHVMQTSDIESMLEKAFRSSNGSRIKDLWNGSWTEWYPSQSEADQAFCNYLAYWIGRDVEVINSIFKKSGLYRSKWDSMRGNKTYGEITIANALSAVNDSCHGDSQEDEWEDPVPYETRISPRFPTESLPRVIRNYVCDASSRLGAPVDYCATAAIVASAALIGKNVYIKPKRNDSWTERACLWGIVVGNPGTKKSPALKEIMKFVDELQKIRSDQFSIKLADWNKKDEHIKLLKKIHDKNQQNHFEKDINALPLPEPDAIAAHPLKPIMNKLIVGDITIEKLGMVLPHTDRLILFRDELSAFINSLNKYTRNNDDERKFYLELYSGTGLEIDRVGRDSIYVKDPCINILGGIQPDVLAEISNKSNDGFMDRFGLIAYPDSQEKFDYIDVEPNMDFHNEIKKMFATLDSNSWEILPFLGRVIPIYKDEDKYKKCITFDDESQERFAEWMGNSDNRNNTGTCVDGFISKKTGLLARIVLVIHLVKVVSGDHSGDCSVVDIATLNDSIKLIDEYFEPMWMKAMSVSLAERSKSQRMLKFLKDHPLDTFTVRDVKQKGLSGLASDREVNDFIESILQLNWIRATDSAKLKTGGRPTTKYEINPKIKL